MRPANTNVGKIFRTLRKQQRLTQKKTADRINKSRSYISRLENGKAIPSEKQLLGFMEAMGVSKAMYDSLIETEHYLSREIQLIEKPEYPTDNDRINDKEELIRKLSEYFVESKVEKAYLFGSFSTETQTDESDVDILIKFRNEDSPTIFDLISIKLDLEDLLARKVDVVEEESVYEHVKKSMEIDKILIYG